jgi:hypothetical protein
VIAAAAGLLVLALVLLLVGIAKSSVAPLVISVIATLGACALLSTSWAYYRKSVASPADAATGGTPYLPVGNGHRPAGPVPSKWDALDDDAASALARTFGFEELQAARAHEVAHAYRKPVLDAIDARIDEIILTRREVG